MASSVSYTDLVQTFTTFLTVSIHTILYERHIYPDTAFISARKYNHPVRQCRHPRVCDWVNDAVALVELELLKCAVQHVVVVIFDRSDTPLERFVFDTSRFPVIPAGDLSTPLSRMDDKGERREVLPLIDLEEQFRAVMSRLSGCGGRLKDIPEGCTFAVAVELKEEAEAPISEPQGWVPAQPGLQRNVIKEATGLRVEKGKDVGGVKTTPIRTVAAGEMLFEVYVEEGKGKFQSEVTSTEDTNNG